MRPRTEAARALAQRLQRGAQQRLPPLAAVHGCHAHQQPPRVAVVQQPHVLARHLRDQLRKQPVAAAAAAGRLCRGGQEPLGLLGQGFRAVCRRALGVAQGVSRLAQASWALPPHSGRTVASQCEGGTDNRSRPQALQSRKCFHPNRKEDTLPRHLALAVDNNTRPPGLVGQQFRAVSIYTHPGALGSGGWRACCEPAPRTVGEPVGTGDNEWIGPIN
jgi:hypothetical protein